MKNKLQPCCRKNADAMSICCFLNADVAAVETNHGIAAAEEAEQLTQDSIGTSNMNHDCALLHSVARTAAVLSYKGPEVCLKLCVACRR